MTSPGFPAHRERLLAPPKNCTFAWLIADFKSICPALNATHLANSLRCLPAFLFQATFSSLAAHSFYTNLLFISHSRPITGSLWTPLFHFRPLSFISLQFSHPAMLLFLQSILHLSLFSQSIPLSFPSHFTSRHLSWPLVFFCFLPTLLPLILSQIVTSVGRICKWGSLHDCYKTQDIKLSNMEKD